MLPVSAHHYRAAFGSDGTTFLNKVSLVRPLSEDDGTAALIAQPPAAPDADPADSPIHVMQHFSKAALKLRRFTCTLIDCPTSVKLTDLTAPSDPVSASLPTTEQVTLRHETGENGELRGLQRDSRRCPIAGRDLVRKLIQQQMFLRSFTIDAFGHHVPRALMQHYSKAALKLYHQEVVNTSEVAPVGVPGISRSSVLVPRSCLNLSHGVDPHSSSYM